ncbi:putative ABC transporter, ATP-binding protein [Desulfosarcina variabilis str. Montpellier]|uniref:ABC transporter ATP-binding protein n=1 Tax=Desulfosarcina variabilis TaxID=2300 RepID=UPI003AFAE36F
MLEIFDIQAGYGHTRVLAGISAAVGKGEVLGIVGPNGAGKTTLIKCIARIIEPSGGRVSIDGIDVRRLSRPTLAQKIGYVPQHLPSRFSMSVFETVLTGRRPHAAWRPSKRDLDRTARVIRQLGLDDLALRDVGELSGGQIQKVLLARALAQQPDYLLLDEPTSSLDLYHQLEVMQMVSALVRQNAIGAIMAMHDLTLAGRLIF